jgi:hypothetical protein
LLVVYKDGEDGFGENGERSRKKKGIANAGFRSENRHGRGWGRWGVVCIQGRLNLRLMRFVILRLMLFPTR